MRKIQAEGHNMTYQSPDTLGIARSGGTAKELSSLVGMIFVPTRSVILGEEITAPTKLPTRLCGSCTYRRGSSISQLFQEEEWVYQIFYLRSHVLCFIPLFNAIYITDFIEIELSAHWTLFKQKTTVLFRRQLNQSNLGQPAVHNKRSGPLCSNLG